MADLCPRTLCIYRPGEKLIGTTCTFHYTGRVPCTGRQACYTCGRTKPGTDRAFVNPSHVTVTGSDMVTGINPEVAS